MMLSQSKNEQENTAVVPIKTLAAATSINKPNDDDGDNGGKEKIKEKKKGKRRRRRGYVHPDWGVDESQETEVEERGVLWYKTSSDLWSVADRTDFKVYGRTFPFRYVSRCPLCLKYGSDCILLPCTHSVHFRCMPPEKNHFFKCPICKSKIESELVVAFRRRYTSKGYIYKPVMWYGTERIEAGEYPLLHKAATTTAEDRSDGRRRSRQQWNSNWKTKFKRNAL
eukprot:jgi/Bigna1/60357/fgenesh1_kg.11_\